MFSGWKPHNIVEDVIVRIEGCYFSVDFLVVDMKITKELSQALIILGRPFLATAKAVTDWGKGEVILKVGDVAYFRHRDIYDDDNIVKK